MGLLEQAGPPLPPAGRGDVTDAADVCRAKVRYPTRAIAEQERHRLARAQRMDDGLFVYGCPECGGFHLTSRPRFTKRKRQKGHRRR